MSPAAGGCPPDPSRADSEEENRAAEGDPWSGSCLGSPAAWNLWAGTLAGPRFCCAGPPQFRGTAMVPDSEPAGMVKGIEMGAAGSQSVGPGQHVRGGERSSPAQWVSRR